MVKGVESARHTCIRGRELVLLDYHAAEVIEDIQYVYEGILPPVPKAFNGY